jgi:hypothetical protein
MRAERHDFPGLAGEIDDRGTWISVRVMARVLRSQGAVACRAKAASHWNYLRQAELSPSEILRRDAE